jgi:hypothetical protein
MKRRRLQAAAGAALAALVVAAAVIAATGGRSPGRLLMGDDVPGDLRALATEVFADFESAFPARMRCMGDVRLVPVWEEMGERARYRSGEAIIELGVPATANLLADSLVHELAHHLESTCPEHRDIRPAFLAAQGHPEGSDWHRGETWESTPSEQFAETVVLVVLGRRQQNVLRMRIEPEAVLLVEAWGSGSR